MGIMLHGKPVRAEEVGLMKDNELGALPLADGSAEATNNLQIVCAGALGPPRLDVVRRKPRGNVFDGKNWRGYTQDDGLVWNDIAAIQKLTALVASADDWPLEYIVIILRENPGENAARGGRMLIDGGRPRRSPQGHRSCSDENK